MRIQWLHDYLCVHTQCTLVSVGVTLSALVSTGDTHTGLNEVYMVLSLKLMYIRC